MGFTMSINITISIIAQIMAYNVLLWYDWQQSYEECEKNERSRNLDQNILEYGPSNCHLILRYKVTKPNCRVVYKLKIQSARFWLQIAVFINQWIIMPTSKSAKYSMSYLNFRKAKCSMTFLHISRANYSMSYLHIPKAKYSMSYLHISKANKSMSYLHNPKAK